MNKKFLSLYFFLVSAFTFAQSGGPSSWSENIRTALEAFVAELDTAHYSTGIQVYDLTADQLLWAYRDHKVMRPASCQKLLTTITALDILSDRYNIQTTASCTGHLVNLSYPEDTARNITYLDGDIYVRGCFDPTYTYDDLLQLVDAIQRLGIDSIAGTIYGDVCFKDEKLLGNGWCWDDEPSVFHPFISPLIFDRGRLTPDLNSYPKDILFNPALHFVKTLATELAKREIPCRGYAINSETPSESTVIYTKQTNITQLLPRTLKNSDNLYAEALFAQIAHYAAGNYAGYKDGAGVIYNVLRKAGADTYRCKIHDGCGLSPYDFITPAALVSMLRYAYKKKSIYDYLQPSLPIAGKDGTLEKRMRRSPAFAKVYAKTGTVTGVSSLSGYATASNGHILAFSIINNGLLKATIGQNLQDRICAELTR